MASLLSIIILLPIMLALSIIFGLEIPFYLGISLLGFSFLLYTEDPWLKLAGAWVLRFGMVLFIVSIVYYISTGTFFPESPFEFRVLKLAGKLLVELPIRIIQAFTK